METSPKPVKKKSAFLSSFRALDLLKMAILAAGYFAAGKFGLSLALVNASATAVWPPSGIALALMLLWGPAVWPGILAGAFFVNWTTAGGIWTSLGIAAGNTLEAVVGAFLIRRFADGRDVLNHSSYIFKFVIYTMASAMISATIGMTTLLLGALARTADVYPIWVTWWLGDFVSIMILTPLILFWSRGFSFRLTFRKAAEALGLVVSVVLISEVVFQGWFHSGGAAYPLEYLGIPLLLWAVFRFGQQGASAIAFLMSAMALQKTLLGRGPFAVQDPNTSLLLLQAFIGTVQVTGLVLAAVLFEQKRVQEERSNFVSTVSHELRTPLTLIKDSLDVIYSEMAGPVSLEQKSLLAMAKKNVDRLAKLIRHVLDFQKLRAGVSLEHQEHDLSGILEEAEKAARVLIAQKNIGFSVRCDSPSPSVFADRDRLLQVLINLLENAVKFTEEGRIALSAAKGDEGIFISVADTGIGIKPEDLPKLFKPFSQIRTAGSRKTGGSGLGLAISKKIVEQHGGRLEVESQEGKGSKFVIFLPFHSRED